MQSRYKVVITGRNIYKEVDFLPDAVSVKIGTEPNCDFRLHRDLFFDKIELDFTCNNGQWRVMCADTLYIDAGDLRKLITKNLGKKSI